MIESLTPTLEYPVKYPDKIVADFAEGKQRFAEKMQLYQPDCIAPILNTALLPLHGAEELIPKSATVLPAPLGRQLFYDFLGTLDPGYVEREYGQCMSPVEFIQRDHDEDYRNWLGENRTVADYIANIATSSVKRVLFVDDAKYSGTVEYTVKQVSKLLKDNFGIDSDFTLLMQNADWKIELAQIFYKGQNYDDQDLVDKLSDCTGVVNGSIDAKVPLLAPKSPDHAELNTYLYNFFDQKKPVHNMHGQTENVT